MKYRIISNWKSWKERTQSLSRVFVSNKLFEICKDLFIEPFAVSPSSGLYLDMHGLIFETSICYWQDQPGSLFCCFFFGPAVRCAAATVLVMRRLRLLGR